MTRTYVVTGSASGVGQATARLLRERGHRVIGIDLHNAEVTGDLSVPQGRVLWAQGAAPDGLYIVEAGVLRASYRFAEHVPPIEESMVPGTLAGELSALSGLARNATVVVERAAVLWKLSAENLRRLDAEQPELARTFTKLVLKCALCLFFAFFAFFASAVGRSC